MTKTLQKKFVRTAMIAVTLLIVLMIGAINLLNAWSVWNGAANMAQMLAMSGGVPRHFDEEERGEYGDEDRLGRKGRDGFSMDSAMAERFFLVRFNEDGEIERTDIGQIYSVTADEAREYAQSVYGGDRETGYRDGFLYVIRKVPQEDHFDPFAGAAYAEYGEEENEEEQDTVVVFLDITGRISDMVSVLGISAAIAAGAWVLMLLFVIMLSRRAIAPIAANIERQKQFVTNAGHELKTPLAIILANTDALELYTGESKWTRNIRTQTQRLSGLMQNLLTLSRMDEIGYELAVAPVDLTSLVREKIQEFSQPAGAKGIAVVQELEEVTVQGHRDTLAQLAAILMDNAVKYTPEGGTICVKVCRSEGKGLLIQRNTVRREEAEEDPERLFDRFYRQDKARTQKKGGYGIGLSAARAIAEANRGSISAAYAMYEEEYNIVFTVQLVI